MVTEFQREGSLFFFLLKHFKHSTGETWDFSYQKLATS